MKKIIITGGSGFIGTNLIENYLNKLSEIEIINIDKCLPKLDSHKKYWLKCDINNYKLLEDIVKSFSPTYIIHLAAETDVSYTKILDFQTNIKGVENICKVVNEVDSIKRVIFTSTQYVHQFHGQPTKDDEYYPFTIYGRSKVEGEKVVRNFNLIKEWVIIRPTNIYGPYNDVYVNGLFRVIQKGYYFHPNIDVKRSYGFVGNIVEQITNILLSNKEKVNKKTFFLGDEPIQLMEFVKIVHKNLGKSSVKTLPVCLFKFAAIIGEIAKKINIPFPMNKTRFINMITPNPFNMENTFKILGKGSYSFEDSIRITTDWYNEIYLNNHKN